MLRFGSVVLVGVLVCVSGAQAQVVIETVTVGSPGNAEDPLNSESIPGIGSVPNLYRIAKYEVTNDQYAEFLNAVAGDNVSGLYASNMAADPHGGIRQNGETPNFTYAVKANMGNKPVNHVSYLDAMRFVNWLHNGQPTGVQDTHTTEDGVYTISDGLSETRADDAKFFIPTENEWYKAAYHQASAQGGDTDEYWLYATASNFVPTIATAGATGDIGNPGTNVANYRFGADWNGQDGNVTTVGSAGALSQSYYGTSDQGGNVWEWNETLVTASSRGLRSGSFHNFEVALQSSFQDDLGPAFSGRLIGFRVAAVFQDCNENGIDDTTDIANMTSIDTDGDGVPDECDICPGYDDFQPCPIPAVSEWGLAAMTLLVLVGGTLLIARRRPVTA